MMCCIYEKAIGRFFEGIADGRRRIDVGMANYFEPGPACRVWGPRTLADYEFIYQFLGTGECREPSGKTVVLTHELLLIPPGVRHTFSCSPRVRNGISCIHFTADPEAGRVPLSRFYGGSDYEIINLFRKAAAEYQADSSFSRELLRQYLREIVIRLFRIPAKKKGLPEKLDQMRGYIESRLDRKITRAELAAAAGLTPEHVNYLFRKHLRETPLRYINRKKIELARRYLVTDGCSVSETAYKTGFQDPYYFSRVFKQIMGMSPTAYISSLV